MKKIIVVIILLVLTIDAFNQELTQKEIKLFCNKFATYISNGDMNNALSYIDEESRIQQHDNFLKGNTEQFFSELLSGVTKNGKFYSPDIKEIKKMKTLKVFSIDKGFAEVLFKITLTDGGTIKTTLTLNVNSKEEMVIISPV